MYRTTFMSSALLSFSLLAAVIANGEEKSAAPTVALQTVYLSNPIGAAHTIAISGQLGGKGQVTLDVNTCTLSQFGDPGVCTEIFSTPIDVTIKQLRLADPTGQGRRIFHLDGKLKPENAKYYLIVPRRRSETHRLVVDLGEDNRRAVTLERQSTKPTGAIELCTNVKYRAEQAKGKVTLYASGKHPTAGWKTAFEQLPIEIFPPQFRTVCSRPSGIAAQVITPFEVKTSFKADDEINQVIVHDGNGQHKVPVKQLD